MLRTLSGFAVPTRRQAIPIRSVISAKTSARCQRGRLPTPPAVRLRRGRSRPASAGPSRQPQAATKSSRRKVTDEDLRCAVRQHFNFRTSSAFYAFDADGDGLISFRDFKRGLEVALDFALPLEKVEQLWRAADADELGFLAMVRFAEFFEMDE